VAVGCLPGDVVVAVCRFGDEWTLHTYRMAPESAADPSAPFQVVRLGNAAGDEDDVDLAVHHSRNWLVVTGLPPPLPSVVRAAIAGMRLGPASDRSCPKLPEGYRPVAVTTGDASDIVLVLRSTSGDDVLAVYDAAGRKLLWLPSGLERVAAIAIGRGDGMLWAVGTAGDGRIGLWRLDATFRENRQAIRPFFASPLTAPSSVVSVSDQAVLVIEATPQPRLSRMRLPAPDASDSVAR
jgi:hypothetical protein